MHQKTRDEFRQYQNLTEEKQIQEKIKFASEAAEVLTKHIVQFKETRPNHYKAQNRPELVWMNDAEMAKQPLREDGGCKLPPVIEPKKRRRIPLK